MRGATLNYVNRLMSHHALMVMEISELTLFNGTNYILIQQFIILNICFKSYFSFRFMIISKFYEIVLKELSAVITVFFFYRVFQIFKYGIFKKRYILYGERQFKK